MPANAAPKALLAFGQEQIVQADLVIQVAYEQASVIGVVDAHMEDELLLQQAHLDRFDLDQVHLGIAVVIAEPTGAARQLQYQEAEQQQAGHRLQLPR
ncbi:hypothetical protein D3C81_1398400 [compost metagenome]